MSLYIGIDIASVDANKNIDWVAAYKAGARFAIIRGSYVNWADPTWAREHARAEAAGLVTGAYLFPDMGQNAPSPHYQVDVFKSALGASYGPGNLPPTLDVEFPGGLKKTGKSRRELILTTLLFEHLMRQAFKIPPMVYSSQRVLDQQDEDALDIPHQNVDMTALGECPYWAARYSYNYRLPAVGDDAGEKKVVESLPVPATPSPWAWKRVAPGGGVQTILDPHSMWIHQYQGDAVKFPGFSATTDLNRFFDLRLGMLGRRVEWLQRRLGMVEGISGLFDGDTEALVIAYQKAQGLGADGVVGPRSFSHLAWEHPPAVSA